MSSACVLLALIVSCSSKIAAAACYDNSQVFKQSEWPHCHQVSASLYVYSGRSGDFMKLGMDMSGHTGGWSALATAGNGGMKGARMIVVRKDTGGAWIAEDRYSQDYVTPSIYSNQDVRLMFAKEANGGTSWGVLLPIDACKPKENGFETNYPLSEDVNRWMLWATGSSHSFGYHKSRGQFHMNLLSGPQLPPSTDGHDTADIVMPNVPVVLGEGGSDESNPYICVIVDLQEITSRDMSLKQHVSKYSPILDADSAQYVHHMVLYGCDARSGFVNTNHLAVIPQCESMPRGCYEFKYPWALGSEDFTMPSNVGVPFGEGKRWVALQMHYYNPQRTPNIRDSSGFRLSFAPSVRQYDAAAWTLNGGVSDWQRHPLPAQTAETVLDFVTPAQCTQQWAGPLNIIGAFHHAHLMGKYLNIDVLRNGKYFGPLQRETGYDFKHQSVNDANVKTLLAGDELHMRCAYDTTARTTETRFGDLTQTEMCFAVFMYYPAQRVSESQYIPDHETDQVTDCGGNKFFKATTYTVPMCTKSGELSSTAAAAISSAVATAAGVTTPSTTTTTMPGKVFRAKLTVTFEDPNAFVQSPHAEIVMKEAIADSSPDLTTSMINILNISIPSRRLSVETRRLAGGVDCHYEVTYPPSHSGPAFTAASVNTTTLMTSIKTKAASRGLTVTVISAVQHEPQLVTAPIDTTPSPTVSACGSAATVAIFTTIVAMLAGQQSK